MPKKTKQQHLQEARKNINNGPLEPIGKVDKRNFVIATLASGTTFMQQKRAFEMCNVEVPSKATFYREQERQIPIIKKCAEESITEARKNTQDGIILSMDGSWDHPRNGVHCNVTGIDCKTDKVVFFEALSKAGGKRTGNCNIASNQMEALGTQNILSQSSKNDKIPIEAIFHDGDNKSGKIIKSDNICKHAEEKYDMRHATSAIKRGINNAIDKGNTMMNSIIDKEKQENSNKEGKTTKIRKRRKNFFKGIAERVVLFFIALVRMVKDPILRLKMWKNMPQHFIGNHADCIHMEDVDDQKKQRGRPKKKIENKKTNYWEWEEGKKRPELVSSLDTFCKQYSDYVENVDCAKGSTQNNESTNNKIAALAPKRISWGDSYTARAAIAITSKNSPITYEKTIMDSVGARISPKLTERRQKSLEQIHKENEAKKNWWRMKSKNEQRNNERADNRAKPGCYGYRKNLH